MSKSRLSRSVWESFVSRFAGSRRPARRRQALVKAWNSGVAAESLEQRLVPTLSVSFAAGTLTLTGDAAANAVTVKAKASYTDVTMGGTFVARITAATSNTISIINFGGAGASDSLSITGANKAITVNLTDVETLSLTSTKSATVNTLTGANTTATVALGVSTVTGDLTVNTASGDITQSGRVSVSGIATFDADTTNHDDNVILTTAGNSFGTVKAKGTTVTIVEAGSTALGSSTVLGAFSVTSSGAITDTDADDSAGLGVLAVTGASTFLATRNAITLNTATSTFGGTLTLTGTNIAVTDNDAGTDLGVIKATGTLSVTNSGAAAGSVTQSGTGITVGGLMTITATGKDIDLDEINSTAGVVNNFGSVSVTGKDVFLKERSSSVLAGVTTSGLLNLISGGGVTDSGDLTVATTTTIATGGAITLDQAGSKFTGALILSGSNIAVTNDRATVLGNTTASGTLTVTSNGAVTELADTTVLTVGGRATINATDSTGTTKFDITLAGTNNNNYGSVAVDGATVSLKENSDTDFFASNTTGSLTVESAGNITDRGDVIVGTTTSLLVAAGKSITLNSTGSEYTGAITVLATTVAKNVTIVNVLPTVLGAISTSGTLNVTSGGAVTQADTLTIGGRATVTATDYNITLNTAANTFGSLSLDGEDVTLQETGSTDLFTSRAKGNFSLTSTGNITDSGTLTIVGSTTLSNGVNDIALDSGASTFGGNLILTASRNVSVKDNDLLGLTLGTSVLTGTLSITAKGNISDAGGAVTGSAGFNSATFVANNGGDITLTQTTLAAGAGGTLSMTGEFATVTMSTPIILGTTTLTGALSITTAGAANHITDSGKIVVGDTVTIDAAGDNITLNSVGNSFGTIILTAGAAVTIVEAGATDLGTSGTLGSLDVTSSGSITDSGVLTVTGATSLTSNGGSISLIQATSTFGALTLRGADITLTDNDAATVLATVTATGAVTLTTAGAVTQTGTATVGGLLQITTSSDDVTLGTTANNFGSVSILGSGAVVIKENSDTNLSTIGATSLTVTSTGAITDSGDLTVSGITDLTAANGETITLDQLATALSGRINLSGSDIAVTNNTSTQLGTVAATGDLSITSAGAVSRTSATNLSVDETATIVATGQTIDLTVGGSGTNNFETIAVTGADVTITEASATDLGTSVVTGTFNLVSGGAVSDSGDLTFSGTTITINANTAGSAINLNSTVSTLTGELILSGTNIAVTSNSAVNLGDITANGTLTITAHGAVTDAGTAGAGAGAELFASGAVVIDAQGIFAITLDRDVATRTGDGFTVLTPMYLGDPVSISS